MIDFALKKRYLTTEYEKPNWIIESGLSLAELTAKVAEFEKENDLPKALIKAKTFELLIENARIAIDKEDIFQDKFLAGNIMAEQKRAWRKAVEKAYLSEETEETKRAWEQFGAYSAHGDYSHISPNSRLLMEVGFTGLLQRVEKAEKRGGLTQKQKEFYQSCKIVLNAMITATNRLAEGVKEYNYENYVALSNIAKGAPSNLY